MFKYVVRLRTDTIDVLKTCVGLRREMIDVLKSMIVVLKITDRLRSVIMVIPRPGTDHFAPGKNIV
jgi:hypothetical protein